MAEPKDVLYTASPEFQINEAAEGGIELVKFGSRRLLWRHVVSESEYVSASERFLDRRKRTSAKAS